MAMAPVRVSLEIFDKVGMEAIREKSLRLTGYLEFLLRERLGDRVEIWTPGDSSSKRSSGPRTDRFDLKTTKALYFRARLALERSLGRVDAPLPRPGHHL